MFRVAKDGLSPPETYISQMRKIYISENGQGTKIAERELNPMISNAFTQCKKNTAFSAHMTVFNAANTKNCRFRKDNC